MADWQKQSFAKNGNAAAPSSMHSKLQGGMSSSLHSKIATPTYGFGGDVSARASMKKAPVRLADGLDVTEEALKQEGMATSDAERAANQKPGVEGFKQSLMSTWDRIKAGNVDDPNSSAYWNYGAGRAKSDRSRAAADIDNESISAGYKEEQEAAKKRPSQAAVDKAVQDSIDMEKGGGASSETVKPSKSAGAKIKDALVDAAISAVAKKAKVKMTGSPEITSSPAPAPDQSAAETKRLAAAPVPKPAYDRNRPDTRPGQPQSVTDKQNEESFKQVPVVRAAKAVGEFFSGSEERYLKAKIARGEKLAPNEEVRAKRLGLI